MVQMVQDEGVERIAVQAVIAYEEIRGWKVESVEQDSRGFDLISGDPIQKIPRQRWRSGSSRSKDGQG